MKKLMIIFTGSTILISFLYVCQLRADAVDKKVNNGRADRRSDPMHRPQIQWVRGPNTQMTNNLILKRADRDFKISDADWVYLRAQMQNSQIFSSYGVQFDGTQVGQESIKVILNFERLDSVNTQIGQDLIVDMFKVNSKAKKIVYKIPLARLERGIFYSIVIVFDRTESGRINTRINTQVEQTFIERTYLKSGAKDIYGLASGAETFFIYSNRRQKRQSSKWLSPNGVLRCYRVFN